MIEWKKVLWIYEKANFKVTLHITSFQCEAKPNTYIQIIQSIKSQKNKNIFVLHVTNSS